ncbi:MAG: Gfo/Idh/MocA family oxidoreductase [Pirellulales bacterium]|nr:Gfo/Idh/MocA family oxidoreductase [Pirellulales bacterium]
MIRIGIVGCGRILAAHLRGYRLLREAGYDGFRITALCARNEADARGYLRRGGSAAQRPAVSQIAGDPLAIGDEYLGDFQPEVDVEIYTDYRQMIATAPIDAVNDFTTHELHHQVAHAALSAGKHLLVQKPLAVTVAAGRWMCEFAAARGLTLGVFENFRHAPSTRQLRWLFEQADAGVGGRLQMVLLGYIGTWWAPDRIVAETPWRHRLATGGGISLDLGVHFFDQIRAVAGEIETVTGNTAVLEPRRVTRDAAGRVVAEIDCDADDTFFATATTRSGAVAQLSASWGGHGGPTVLGSGTVWYGSRGRVDGDCVTTDDGQSHSLAELYRTRAPLERQRREFPLGLADSFALSQFDWLQAIEGGRLPETSGREGLLDLAAAYAILESHAARQTVRVAEVLGGQIDAFQRPLDEHFRVGSLPVR